jgi:pyruvate/2-oxoglutarate dehydrogenase complex dihydrolipoamide acyltransferase (E2) component
MPGKLVRLEIARHTEDTEDAEHGVVLDWRVSEGAVVSLGQVVAEIEVGKSAIEIVAVSAGTVLKILHLKDATVPIGDVLAVIGDPGEDWEQIVSSSAGASGAGVSPPVAQGIRCRGECPECGARVAINGPVRSVFCSECGTQTELSTELWNEILEIVASRHEFARLRVDHWLVVVRVTEAPPQCHNCDTELAVTQSRLDDRQHTSVACSSCGLGHEQSGPPEWLRSRFPWLGSVLGMIGPRPSRERQAEASPQCPSCGARHVSIADGTPVPRCSYCGMDVWSARSTTPVPRRWYLLR